MRYLKLYEEWEPKNSVKEDIKDIFIDLTDNYLDVQITDTKIDKCQIELESLEIEIDL
jgi:hypothetical protein